MKTFSNIIKRLFKSHLLPIIGLLLQNSTAKCNKSQVLPRLIGGEKGSTYVFGWDFFVGSSSNDVWWMLTIL